MAVVVPVLVQLIPETVRMEGITVLVVMEAEVW
jgi:hypothetical protein